jgi:hypothetical protein
MTTPKFAVPGFTAQESLYKATMHYSRRQYSGIAKNGQVVPQIRMHETFVISPGRTCYCYEDTDAQASFCECD